MVAQTGVPKLVVPAAYGGVSQITWAGEDVYVTGTIDGGGPLTGLIVRSSDFGATWTTNFVDTHQAYPAITSDPGGNIYAAESNRLRPPLIGWCARQPLAAPIGRFLIGSPLPDLRTRLRWMPREASALPGGPYFITSIRIAAGPIMTRIGSGLPGSIRSLPGSGTQATFSPIRGTRPICTLLRWRPRLPMMGPRLWLVMAAPIRSTSLDRAQIGCPPPVANRRREWVRDRVLAGSLYQLHT